MVKTQKMYGLKTIDDVESAIKLYSRQAKTINGVQFCYMFDKFAMKMYRMADLMLETEYLKLYNQVKDYIDD